jgi:hypothetical protein
MQKLSKIQFWKWQTPHIHATYLVSQLSPNEHQSLYKNKNTVHNKKELHFRWLKSNKSQSSDPPFQLILVGRLSL